MHQFLIPVTTRQQTAMRDMVSPNLLILGRQLATLDDVLLDPELEPKVQQRLKIAIEEYEDAIGALINAVIFTGVEGRTSDRDARRGPQAGG